MSETALAFFLCFFVGLNMALFVRPMYGLYTYVAVFYLDPPSRWWGNTLPDFRWSLVAAIVTLLAVLIHRRELHHQRPWYSSSIAKVLILYTAWMWIQAPWVPSSWHMDGVILFSKYVLLLFLLWQILDNRRDFFGFCLAHVAGCAYLGWLVYLAPSGGRLEGVGGPGIDNANTLGMHLSTGLIFAGFLLLIDRGWRRWMALFAIPFILNGIIQTQTRGAIVGLFLGGLATVYLKPNKFRKRYYGLAVLAIVSVVALGNQAFVARMRTLTAAVDEQAQWDNSAESRIEIVKAQWRMFKDNPFGAGHEGTTELSTRYMDSRLLASNSGNRASHNTVMSVLVDQGVPGILLVVVLGATIVRKFRWSKTLDKRGLPDDLALARAMLGGALIAILGAGMFAQYLKAEVMIWTLALIAILWELSAKALPAVESSSTDAEEDEAEATYVTTPLPRYAASKHSILHK